MKQSTYLCVILHVKHKKLPILSVFNYEISISGKNSRWRQFLGTPQASSRWAIFYGCGACWEDERLFNTTAKSFRNTAIYQKLKGEVPSTPTPNPPPPPCKTVRVWLAFLYFLAYFGKEMLRNNNGFSRLFFSHCVKNINRSFSVTWSAALQIAWNNRKF